MKWNEFISKEMVSGGFHKDTINNVIALNAIRFSVEARYGIDGDYKLLWKSYLKNQVEIKEDRKLFKALANAIVDYGYDDTYDSDTFDQYLKDKGLK